MLNLRHIIKSLTGELLLNGKQPISEVVIDSRMVTDNSLFVAIPGERVDGHDFVETAFDSGASYALIEHEINTQHPVFDLRSGTIDPATKIESPACILVENTVNTLQTMASYWREQFNPRVIGITGSVGKSSTKELAASVLSRRFITLKSAGNMNNEIGLPLSLMKLRAEHEVAVLEMGFYVPGEIKLLCDIAKPQVGLVTNIGEVHAERAGSIETIAKGKAELIEALPPAPEGLAILNHDDPLVKAMAKLTKARVFYYGLTHESHLWADEIEGLGLEGIRCRLHYQGETVYVKAPLMGRHSVYTLLRAAAIALLEGMSWEWIVYALQSSKVQLRLSTVRSTNGALLIDDTYNASPASTLAALNLLHDLEGRKVAVLGDMLELGQYEQQGHEKVGIRAAEVADEIVLIGERSKVTQSAILSTGFKASKVHWFSDAQAAAAYLETVLKEGDTTLIKGSHSMHMDQIIAALEVRS